MLAYKYDLISFKFKNLFCSTKEMVTFEKLHNVDYNYEYKNICFLITSI